MWKKKMYSGPSTTVVVEVAKAGLSEKAILLPFAFGLQFANEFAATNARQHFEPALSARANGRCTAVWVTDIKGEVMDLKSWDKGALMPVLVPGKDEGDSYHFDYGFKVGCM